MVWTSVVSSSFPNHEMSRSSINVFELNPSIIVSKVLNSTSTFFGFVLLSIFVLFLVFFFSVILLMGAFPSSLLKPAGMV